VDLRYYAGDNAFQYALEAQPRWIRAGDVFWNEVEPSPGVYNWGALAAIETNVRRIRAAGIEPTLIVQRTPSWAQKIPGRLCSPPKPENIPDFARFLQTLAARYSSGPLAVNYWEIWNEPDYGSNRADSEGVGCWADASLPHYGGEYYGQALRSVYPAVKAANPKASVMVGALAYFWPDDSVSSEFLKGIMASGAANSFDMISFHAYGASGPNDLMVAKTLRIRQILQSYGRSNVPLMATEVAATCGSNDITSCQPNFSAWLSTQSQYTARIYAEAIALGLNGAFWYSLALPKPGFAYSQLIDDANGTLAPRPSFYAFRNSARLLQGATYVGPPLQAASPDKLHTVQSLVFRRRQSSVNPVKGSTLYVLWVAELQDTQSFPIPTPAGVRPICTDQLDGDPYVTNPNHLPRTSYCAPSSDATTTWVGVGPMPKYVEVIDP
jgi:hypothetical protein